MKVHGYLLTSALALLTSTPTLAQSGPRQALGETRDTFVAEAPDTTGFWFYLRRGERDRAREELARLERLAPDWEPPAAMLEALAEPQATQAELSAEAKADRAHGQLMEDIAGLPESGRQQLPSATLERAIAGARERRRADELLLLAWVALARGSLDEARALFFEAQGLDATIDVSEGLDEVNRTTTRQALAAQDVEVLRRLLRGPRRQGSIELILAEAWQRLDDGDPAAAATLFRLVPDAGDSATGRALALQALGEDQKVVKLACEKDDRRLAALCIQFLEQLQLEAYERDAWSEVIAIANQLELRGGLFEGALELRAWAHYRLGRRDAALADFILLLESQPERQDIGLSVLSLLESDRSRLREVAALHPAVASALRVRERQAAFSRRQFDLAARLGHELLEDERGLELSGGRDWRERNGEPGLNRLVTERLHLEAGALEGRWRWNIRAIDNEFRQGAFEAGQWFATAALTESAPGTTESGAGVRAELSRQEPGFNLYAALARDPLNQRANESLTGQLSVGHFGELATSALTVYHRYRDDTLLARIGSIDPRSSLTWGGALATGARGLLSYPLSNHWRLTGSGFAESIDGDAVDGNFGYGLRLDLNHTTRLAGNGYRRLGPFLSHWHYDENRNAFTIGQGGYFSPDRFNSAGLAMEWLSAEGQHWQFKVAGNIAYSVVEQSAYLRFPLVPTGPPVPATRDTGPSGELTLQFQYRLAPHWRIAAFAYYLEAIEFESAAAGVELVWSPGKRSAVFSDSLPLENPWIKGYAL